jgi:hypothetical protein
VVILAETGDITRFEPGRKLAATGAEKRNGPERREEAVITQW